MKKAMKIAVWLWFIIFVFLICSNAPVNSSSAAFASPSSSLSPLPSSLNHLEVQAAMRASVQRLGLQTQLPASEEITAEGRSSLEDFLPRPNRSHIPNVATILFFAALIAIAVIVLMTWRDNLWSSSQARNLQNLRSFTSGDGGASSEFTAWEERSRLEADELASCGNFAEAMRVLLLRSVEELRRHLRVSIAASLTSREILYHVSLPSKGRPVLADIINRVEVSYFGSHKPGADEYKACRDSFDALTDVLRQHSTTGSANAFVTL